MRSSVKLSSSRTQKGEGVPVPTSAKVLAELCCELFSFESEVQRSVKCVACLDSQSPFSHGPEGQKGDLWPLVLEELIMHANILLVLGATQANYF